MQSRISSVVNYFQLLVSWFNMHCNVFQCGLSNAKVSVWAKTAVKI